MRRRLPAALHGLAHPLAVELLLQCPGLYAPTIKTIAQVLQGIEEFLRIWRYCRRHNVWPDLDLSTPVMAPFAAFADLRVLPLRSAQDVADWLFLPVEKLDYFADPLARHEHHGETGVNHYHYNLHRKSLGGVRLIEAPKQVLKSVQRHILRDILDHVPVHRDVFGFVRGRDCLAGAERHAGEAMVISFDLKNFFPSVAAARVFGLFRCLGYPEAVARLLTGFCTTRTPPRILERLISSDRPSYRQSHLPQGAPSSPALANLACFPLDRRLSGLATRIDANYSRYADDFTFSGDRHIRASLMRMVPEIVADERFQLNPQKTRIMSANGLQVETRIVVNQHLNVTRARFDRLKAIIHACGKSGDARLSDPAYCASLVAQIDWVARLNPARGAKLRKCLALTLTS